MNPSERKGRPVHLHVTCLTCTSTYEFTIRATGSREEDDARAEAVLGAAGATMPGQSGIKCPRCHGRPPSGKLRRINPEDPKTWRT